VREDLFRPGLLLIAVTLAGLASGCAGRAQAQAPAAVPVVTALAAATDVPLLVRAIGTVEAYQTVTVRAQATGTIARVHFQEGADVRQGDLLFSIDPRPLQAALHQAEAALARDQAQARNAVLQARRADELMAQGIISQDQHDLLQTASDALEASVAADRANVENARLQLAYCSVTAPASGRTGSLLVQEGNVVKGVDGAPLVVINTIDPVYVSFTVPEKRLAEVKAASAAGKLVVEASLAGVPGDPEKGQLSFVDNAVDRTTGTIRLKGTFGNAQRHLWPGQFVDVRLVLSTQHGVIVVPAEAVQSGQAGPFVFVVKPDQTVEPRNVVVDDSNGQQTVVRQGLQAGDRVVTDGQLRLVPGARVEAKAEARPDVKAPAAGGDRS
jgi:multidrug efflux system membrane fusion protein